MLTTTLKEQFEEQGYVVVSDLLDPQHDLQPIVDDYTRLLDELAERWHREGYLPSSYRELPFDQRLMRVAQESGQPWYSHFDISLPWPVTADSPIYLGAAVFNLLRNPTLLDVVEQFIGPEIFSNPIQHVRVKPPERYIPGAQGNTLVTRTDWHQDQGVALPEVDETEMLTVWVAVTDATVENGCLCVIPGSHRGDLVTHCPGKPGQGLHIPDSLIGPNATPLPMRRGSVLFMHRRTMHSSLPNVSDGLRWSFDLRYQPIGQPTGRPAFPGFIARSRSHPERELRDPRAWAQLWLDSKARLTGLPVEAFKFNRWTGEAPVCA